MKTTNRIIQVLACLTIFACASAVTAAETWYVDDDNYGKSGDGKTAKAAFGTIQEAVNAAATGDTVKVLPGTYDRGGYDDGFTSNRVFVAGKKLRIESTQGKAVTFIVGRHSSDASGFGRDAVRCAYIESAEATCGTEIRGFTLKDGGVAADDGSVDGRLTQGGGLYAEKIGGSFLIDCTIENCWARGGGGLQGGGAIRCLFVGNVRKGGSNGAVSRSAYLLNCICVNNDLGGQPAMQGGYAVNCTFVGNGNTGIIASENSRMRNCLSILNNQNLSSETATMSDIRRTVCAGNAFYDAEATQYDEGVVTNAPFDQLLAPALGDFRPLAGSIAATNGRGELLDAFNEVSSLKVPAGEVYFDFDGRAIPTNGAIAVGAVQEIAPAPVSGGALFPRNSFRTFGYVNLTDFTYAYPTSYPSMFHFSKDLYEDGQGDVFAYWINVNNSENRRAPEMDDSFFLMPPPSPGTFVTNGVQAATEAFYVKKDGGDNGNAGTSDAPFKSITRACEAASTDDRTVVYVAKGEYDEATEGATCAYYQTNRVVVPANKNIRIKGAGKGLSVICGKAHPETLGNDQTKYGMTHCGPSAARCVATLGNMILQGFTLADGHSNNYENGATGDELSLSRTAGAVYGNTYSIVADCLVTNAICGRGICYNGNYVRVEFRDCYGYNGGFRGCRSFSSCLLTGTTGSGAGPVFYNDNKTVCHCSVKGPATNTSVWDGADAISTWNCVFVTGNKLATSSEETARTKHYGNFIYDYTTMPTYDFHTYADPLYASDRDLRPRAGSPLFGGGVKPTADNYGATYWMWVTSDLNGKPIVFDAEGRPTVGCEQRGVSTVTIAAPKLGTVTPSGEQILDDGASLTVTYTPDPAHATRPYFGIAVDGERVTEGCSYTVTGPKANEAIRGISVEILSETNWYVNANATSSSGNGWTPETAKKTLADIMACDILSGDCIHAAAGDYDAGVMSANDLFSSEAAAKGITSNRVVIADGVTLVADEGAAKTRILGSVGDNPDATKSGRGYGALRCVLMRGSSVLRGFTLENGTCSLGNDESGPSVDRDGGGVLAMGKSSARICDCVIRNCAANRGGGALYGTFVNCRFSGNASIGAGQGDASRGACLYGCYMGVQRSSNGTQSPSVVKQCTFDGSALNAIGSIAIDNTLFRNPNSKTLKIEVNAGAKPTFDHCAFDAENEATWKKTLADATFNDCLTPTLAKLQLDDGVPVIGACEAIDAGDDSLLPGEVGETDAAQGQRIYNGRVDIGAIEADWRGCFARVLGGGTAVSFASPDVTTNQTATALSLGDGERVSLVWNVAEGRRAEFSALVGGTLQIYENAELWKSLTTGVAAQTVKFRGAGERTYTFVAESAASEIGAFRTNFGLMLLVR